jgi:hypothetical protein
VNGTGAGATDDEPDGTGSKLVVVIDSGVEVVPPPKLFSVLAPPDPSLLNVESMSIVSMGDVEKSVHSKMLNVSPGNWYLKQYGYAEDVLYEG